MDILNSIGLLILRLSVGGLMLTHGISKIMLVANGNASGFLNPLGIGAIPSIWLAIFAEVGCSALLIFGCFTRIAAAILATNMCVVCYFWFSQNSAWSNFELPLMYLGIYVTLIFTGAGKFALDSKI